MKAIETRYHGYRFRSRLEARWAVFFDALAWPYLYEPEGFVLAYGTRYLPDFYLPDFGVWFEIKGMAPTEEELNTARLFVDQGARIYLLHGQPYSEQHGVSFWEYCHEGGGEFHIDEASFTRCRRCQRGVWLTGDGGCVMLQDCKPGCLFTRLPIPTPDILAAYAKARAARFEHGEHP